MNRKIFAGILTLLYIAGFILLSKVQRTEFWDILGVVGGLFAIYFISLRIRLSLSLPITIALFAAVRLPFFFELPLLSDDFYRFLWDGMMLNEGLSPFGRLPVEQELRNFDDPLFAEMLLERMNSQAYFTVYPTFMQAVFGVSYFFSGSSLMTGVNVMRSIMVLFEILFFLVLIFKRGKEERVGMAYLLNPLVVVEGVGNLHFEAILLPWLALALLNFKPLYYLSSAIPWAGSILFKLTPAILAPVFFFKLPVKKRFPFFLTVAVVLFIFLGMFQPWTGIGDFNRGIGLYFNSFEFNAGLYYFMRYCVFPYFSLSGGEYIAAVLAISAVPVIVLISYLGRKSEVFEPALLSYVVFLCFSSTVHPWYIIPVVYLALRSKRYLILVWSFTAFFSYSHYLGEWGPKWLWIGVEYGTLILALAIETWKKPWLAEKAIEAQALRG